MNKEMQKAQDELDAHKKQIDDNLSMSVKPVFMTNNIENEVKMKYKIRNKNTGDFIKNHHDYSDRVGWDIGSFSIKPDGTLVFFESTDGGMDEIECPELEVVFETSLTEQHQRELDIAFTKGEIAGLKRGQELALEALRKV